MTGEAHGGVKHVLSVLKVAGFEIAVGESEHAFHGVAGAGAFGRDVVGDLGVEGLAGELVEGGALGFGGEGERFFAGVFDEAVEAVAAFPCAGDGEPVEVGAAEIRCPA